MSIEVTIHAGPASHETHEDGTAALVLATDRHRVASLEATLTRPDVLRDALTALRRVAQSDLRFKASDRSDYLAFLLKQGKRATKELWDAQKAFLDEQYGEATREESPLDAVVSVRPNDVSFEVMSADESAYACLTLRAGEAYRATEQTAGVSYLPLDSSFDDAVRGMRGFRETSLRIARGTGDEGARTLSVPERWVRALAQVQAASTVARPELVLTPIDLYNLLFTIRMRRAATSPRALRYELVPGERPRMVLEPWDLLIEATGEPYAGPIPVVYRTFGRRRLAMLSSLLAHVERVRVFAQGAGLPVFYVMELEGATFTVALSGWTDRGWAGIGSFDLLVPREVQDDLGASLLDALRRGPATLSELSGQLGKPAADLRAALLVEIQRAQIRHERATDRYRARALFETPLELETLRFRDDIEAQAHRWLEVEGQVRILKTHDLGEEGLEIEGEVEDRKARRTYKTSFTLDREGRTVNASCTSRQFRRSGLKEGPTAPMIALRLLYAKELRAREAARDTEEGRRTIRAETRTLLRREGKTSFVYKVSLDDRQVVLRWGRTGEAPRLQRMLFGSPDGARTEYFRRLSGFAERGFIDASSAEAVG